MESLKLQFMQELSPALKSGCTEVVLLNAIETLVRIIGTAKWKGQGGGGRGGEVGLWMQRGRGGGGAYICGYRSNERECG